MFSNIGKGEEYDDRGLLNHIVVPFMIKHRRIFLTEIKNFNTLQFIPYLEGGFTSLI